MKIALMIEESGFLCVQIMMPVSGSMTVGEHQGIIEFKVSPNSSMSTHVVGVSELNMSRCTRWRMTRNSGMGHDIG